MGYVIMAMDGTVIWANPAFLELSGQTPPLPPTWTLQQTLSKAAGIFFETHVIPILLLRRVSNELALELVRPSGERLPVLANAKLERNSEGEPHFIALTLMEIRERRQYERELLRAQKGAEQMAEIVRRSTDAILTISAEGQIQSWNQGAEQMFAYTQEEAIGSSFVKTLFRDDEIDGLRQVLALLAQGQEATRDMIGVHKSGREVEVSISFTPHMEAPGVLVAFSAIIRDITSRKQAEKALIQSEKLASVGRLASSIAHEINNPLESVTNLLYILAGQVTDPETKALVNIAQEELGRVSHIVTHTLRFHRQSSARSEVDVRTLFDSLLSLYRARLQAFGIAVDLTRAYACPLVCYEGELRQIFANLIGNAFDAMRAHSGRLILRSRQATQWASGLAGVRITIADTGHGMDASTIQHAFEPFFTTKGVAGTGLGLWITQELVAKNGGSIRVRSSNRSGKSGSVFMLTFSLALPDLHRH